MVEFRKDPLYKQIINQDKRNQPTNKEIGEKLKEIEEYTVGQRNLWPRQPDHDRPRQNGDRFTRESREKSGEPPREREPREQRPPARDNQKGGDNMCRKHGNHN